MKLLRFAGRTSGPAELSGVMKPRPVHPSGPALGQPGPFDARSLSRRGHGGPTAHKFVLSKSPFFVMQLYNVTRNMVHFRVTDLNCASFQAGSVDGDGFLAYFPPPCRTCVCKLLSTRADTRLKTLPPHVPRYCTLGRERWGVPVPGAQFPPISKSTTA